MLYCKEVNIDIWDIEEHPTIERVFDNICDFREDNRSDETNRTSVTFGIYRLSREQLLLWVSSLISAKANFQILVGGVEEVDPENKSN